MHAANAPSARIFFIAISLFGRYGCAHRSMLPKAMARPMPGHYGAKRALPRSLCCAVSEQVLGYLCSFWTVSGKTKE
jgi:hypothetical protein